MGIFSDKLLQCKQPSPIHHVRLGFRKQKQSPESNQLKSSLKTVRNLYKIHFVLSFHCHFTERTINKAAMSISSRDQAQCIKASPHNFAIWRLDCCASRTEMPTFFNCHGQPVQAKASAFCDEDRDQTEGNLAKKIYN